jgi:hypothetical protein
MEPMRRAWASLMGVGARLRRKRRYLALGHPGERRSVLLGLVEPVGIFTNRLDGAWCIFSYSLGH